jgi:CRISPR-associated protein Csb2
MLAIEVAFLLGRYTATDYRDRGRPEWPPHPDRLFSALTASAARTPDPTAACDALRWLERLPPPHLHADLNPGRPVDDPVTVFVPVNDPVDDLPTRVEKQPRSFPSVVPTGPAVFVWPDAEPDENLRRRLAGIAVGMTYLGSSRSPVLARLTDDPPAPVWVPDPDGDIVLRVPRPGPFGRTGLALPPRAPPADRKDPRLPAGASWNRKSPTVRSESCLCIG